jgi:hypothetical protein
MPAHLTSRSHLQTYNLLWATMEQYIKQGLNPESSVLDIRNVDVSNYCPVNVLVHA